MGPNPRAQIMARIKGYSIDHKPWKNKISSLILWASSPFHTFPKYDNIIKNVPRFYEINFILLHNLYKEMIHLQSQSFSDDLIRNIEQGDRYPTIDILQIYTLTYEIDISFIYKFIEWIGVEKFKIKFTQVLTNTILDGLVRREAIITRSSISLAMVWTTSLRLAIEKNWS